MTPIEKSRAEDCALQVLRIRRQARRDEIKTAWRRRIVETHPDRNSGDDSQFQLVQAAYAVVKGTATEDNMEQLLKSVDTDDAHNIVADATGPARSNPRRARVKTRLVWFESQDEAQSDADKPQNVPQVRLDGAAVEHVDGDAEQSTATPVKAEDTHRVQRVRQKGRRVSYIIWSLVKLGDNEVSLPKGDFRRAGESNEVELQFASSSEGAATVTLSEDQRAAHFPGAQSVRAHFAHGADQRP